MTRFHDPPAGLHAPASGSQGIDVLSEVLRSVRLAGSMLFLVVASRPWASQAPRAAAFGPQVLPGSSHVVSYHVVARGACWAGLEGGTPVRLEEGDIFVVPHGHAYWLADRTEPPTPDTREEAVTFFRRMAAGELAPVVHEGGGGAPQTLFICGFLGCDLRPFNPVLAALPAMIHVRRSAHGAHDRMGLLVEYALAELSESTPGGRDVLLRLSELMFVEVLRCHARVAAGEAPGWLAALADPLVARALACLHEQPARAWTLERLATLVGASRSVLAERFTRVVGLPPMQYLAAWRMQIASDLLRQASLRVKAVAASVGYESEAAFSRAFKKAAGTAPRHWRERGAAASAPFTSASSARAGGKPSVGTEA